jgi:myo-inositol-1(or 4)-monophosphatase
MEKRLQQIIALAKDVGVMQVERFGQKHRIERKTSQFDLVTEVDKLSEKTIVEWLHTHYPEDAILAEESGRSEGAPAPGHDGQPGFTWVVDPLDGTTNYSHKFPIYCISIALTRKEETVLGVVYAPALGELFYASSGQGAFLNGARISVSDCPDLESALLGTGFPYNRTGAHTNLPQFNHICPMAQGVRRTGSAAYDLCCVAAGRFDGFWEYQLRLWDVAAAALIIEEAGGLVTFLSRRDTEVSLAAGNRALCDLLCHELLNS